MRRKKWLKRRRITRQKKKKEIEQEINSVEDEGRGGTITVTQDKTAIAIKHFAITNVKI